MVTGPSGVVAGTLLDRRFTFHVPLVPWATVSGHCNNPVLTKEACCWVESVPHTGLAPVQLVAQENETTLFVVAN